MNVLTIKELSKNFGTQKIIDNLNFSVPEGTVFGFIGQNGAGKTTTMKMILGLLKADSGEITICGQTVSYGQTKTNRYVGYLPDVPEFYNYMKPLEYLTLCGKFRDFPNRKPKVEVMNFYPLWVFMAYKTYWRFFPWHETTAWNSASLAVTSQVAYL